MTTLKLVSDNGETVEIGALGLVDEVNGLAGELADTTTLITISLGDGFSQIRVLGEQLSHYSLMGIFEAAKFEMMSDLLEGE